MSFLQQQFAKFNIKFGEVRGDFNKRSDINDVKLDEQNIKLNELSGDMSVKFNEINTSIVTVSYTHLDVYKRQM